MEIKKTNRPVSRGHCIALCFLGLDKEKQIEKPSSRRFLLSRFKREQLMPLIFEYGIGWFMVTYEVFLSIQLDDFPEKTT